MTCDVGYLCANFSLPRPLCSRLRPDVRDRQTKDVRRASSLNAPYLGGIINSRTAAESKSIVTTALHITNVPNFHHESTDQVDIIINVQHRIMNRSLSITN